MEPRGNRPETTTVENTLRGIYDGFDNGGNADMSTVTLSKDDFGQTVRRDGIVLVDFWAAWCGPCRRFAPVFEQASTEHPDIVFGKVDTEAEPELAAAAEISSIPTLMAFRDGVLVFRQPGALPASALAQLIEAVRGLDMDEVRGKLSGHPAA
jgi:thioredoxin 1